VIIEARSTNTYENARFSASYLVPVLVNDGCL
jgi:uncharacterized SAM-binding protein YcdF (DUF218 family)